MYKICKERLLFAKRVYLSRWQWVVAIVWGVPYGLGAFYDFLKGQGYLPEWLPIISQFVPDWLLWVWLSIGILAFIIIIFESSYRYAKYTENKALAEVAVIRHKLDTLKSHADNPDFVRGDIFLVYDPIYYSVCIERLGDKSEIRRIGILNTSDKTMEGVEVRLVCNGTNLEPEPLPGALSPMHSAAESLSSFILNPTRLWPVMFVDFVRWYPKDKTIKICYHDNLTHKVIPYPDTYKMVKKRNVYLSLVVTARDRRQDAQWIAELLLGQYGNLDIGLEEFREHGW